MTVTCPACATRVPMVQLSGKSEPRLVCRRCGERLTGTGALAPLDNDLLMDWLGGTSRRDEPYKEFESVESADTLESAAASELARPGRHMKKV